MSVPLNVRRRLSSVIKNFRFDELESTVLPNFPETTWNRVRSRLVKHHENFTVLNALRIIEQAIDDAKVSDKALNERIATLELLAVSRHHTKKVWYAFSMTEGNARVEDSLTHRDMQRRIVQNFHIHQMEIDVRVSSHDGITFVSMRDKPRGKQTRRMIPVFFALFPGQKYLFCAKKNVTKEYITVMVDSLNYGEARELKLMGRDLKSLLKMLWMKEQGTVDSNGLNNPPKFRDSEPVINKTGIDFRQNKQRREYVEQCFGEEPPTLEMLVAEGPTENWKNAEIADKLQDTKVRMKWEFRGTDIAMMLTKLTEQRVITMPPPNYIMNFMTGGENTVKIDYRTLENSYNSQS